MPILSKVFLFFWRNPYAAIALLIGLMWGWIQWQGYRIEGIKIEKQQMERELKSERVHSDKVSTAIDDKGKKDADRTEFKRRASAEITKKATAETPAPAVRDAYQRVFDRIQARSAANP